MATVRLTETRVRNLRHDPDGSKVQRLWDAEVPGLALEVTSSGRRSWIFRYRLFGRQSILTLGRQADYSLSEAREEAIRYRQAVRQGVDPRSIRDAPQAGLTLGDLFEQYTSTRYFRTRSPDFQANMRSTFNKYLAPMAHLPLAAVTRSHIREAVTRLIETGKEGAARGLLNRARILFNYALEHELIEHSPADHITPRYLTTGRRVMWLDTAEKIKAAWYLPAAPQTRALVRWALLTGCRRDEARLTRRINLTEIWTVADTKNNHPLILPVMPAMQAILDESRATWPACEWLFPATSDPKKPIPRGTLDYQIRVATGGAWSMHILRHTVESWLREIGIPEEDRDLILNHRRRGTGDRYSHGAALERKKETSSLWHNNLREILDSV